MRPSPSRAALILRLAIQDLWHDRQVSLCIAAALVAVIAPLLLLFGLKHGVVSQLQRELLDDPRNLEVRMLTSGSYDEAWLDDVRALPGVGFAIGLTRSLNTQADLLKDRRHFLKGVELVPSAIGDPLLADLSRYPQGSGVVLSEPAARRLDVAPGERLTLAASRRLEGQQERGRVEVEVIGVLDAARFPRPAAFIDLELLIELERFRDGHASPLLGVTSGAQRADYPLRYARARIFASEGEAVAGVVEQLEAQRIETASRLADIENVRAINRVLGLIFGVIALTALVGCLASMAGAFMANIDRKRREYAVLRLLGLKRPAVAAYVAVQVGLLSLIAFVAGLGLFALGAAVFNRALATSHLASGVVSHITAAHALIALALTLGVALLVAAIGVARAFSIQPAESLREA
ncbi:ABC transporter permease [Halomonas saccharevitans]|uniref:Putative ABC transport system permease protein n=1 Tax=Halomonas saccharevitans TaxID=416872 RepID=A0A1I7BWL1_9GAMM|nr:FtsX-like permease family protein [Halomonas saccharevitans]SFT91596.1 putative ABC transport system permease protein [Halomonas saccharevitans]